MNYALLANLTAITHFLLVLSVLVGLLISFRYKRFRPWEAGIVLVVIVFWSIYGNCPLTFLEAHLRELAHAPLPLVEKGFLPYYINKITGVFIPGPIIGRTTYFVGGMFFLASMEWLSPFFHLELFKIRKFFKKRGRKLYLTRARRV